MKSLFFPISEQNEERNWNRKSNKAEGKGVKGQKGERREGRL